MSGGPTLEIVAMHVHYIIMWVIQGGKMKF